MLDIIRYKGKHMSKEATIQYDKIGPNAKDKLFMSGIAHQLGNVVQAQLGNHVKSILAEQKGVKASEIDGDEVARWRKANPHEVFRVSDGLVDEQINDMYNDTMSERATRVPKADERTNRIARKVIGYAAGLVQDLFKRSGGQFGAEELPTDDSALIPGSKGPVTRSTLIQNVAGNAKVMQMLVAEVDEEMAREVEVRDDADVELATAMGL